MIEQPKTPAIDFDLDAIGDNLRASARALVNSGYQDSDWVGTRERPHGRMVCLYGPSLFAFALKLEGGHSFWMPEKDQEETPMGRLALQAAAKREEEAKRSKRTREAA
jgi:hypothetical protein